MDDKLRVQHGHRFCMEDRKSVELTGITDVASFDPEKVVLESDFGNITIKGAELHVKRLSVEKKEMDIEGKIDSFAYSESGSYAKKGESIIGRLFR